MTLEELGKLFDRIAECYPQFNADLGKMQTWHAVLKDVPYKVALDNLYSHVSDPANRYPPHPGALLADTETDRYHTFMKESGQNVLKEYDLMKSRAVPPTDEQRRRVREALGKSG